MGADEIDILVIVPQLETKNNNKKQRITLFKNVLINQVLEVTYAEPGVKGNTATNATKSATVETGATVNVPLFINEGDKIKIDTASGSYMERVKE